MIKWDIYRFLQIHPIQPFSVLPYSSILMEHEEYVKGAYHRVHGRSKFENAKSLKRLHNNSLIDANPREVLLK